MNKKDIQMNLIKIKKKLRGGNLTSDEYIEILRKRGTIVGEGTWFPEPQSVRIDSGYPYCVEIGAYVTITSHVLILAHDYSYSVLNQVYNIMPQNSYKTVIGNNVFIGQRSIILPGAEIGNNVIIGAGAVVHGRIPDNTVWAGNPAKQICTLEEYKEKRVAKYEEGAIVLARQIIKNTGKKPTYKDMRMYIGLFAPRTPKYRHYFDELPSSFPNVPDHVWEVKQKYENLDDFLYKNNLI